MCLFRQLYVRAADYVIYNSLPIACLQPGSWSQCWVTVTCCLSGSPLLQRRVQQGWISDWGGVVTLNCCCPWPWGSVLVLAFPSGQSLQGMKCSKALKYIL